MKSRTICVLIIISLIQILQFLQINASCVCNEQGTDYCKSCNELRVVRPKQRYEQNPEIDLPPIGDNCWCSKLLIEPAVLPKPPCPKPESPLKPCGCKSSSTCNCKSSSNCGCFGSYHEPRGNYISKAKDYSAPADPISVSLAIQAGKAIQVPEAKLAYGFVRKPVDGTKKVYFSNVPEENLYKLNKEVITLKKRVYAPKKEEESIEIEEEEEPHVEEDDEKPHLTYKQLGYEIEKYKNPRFRQVPSSYYASSREYVTKCPKVKIDCGFKPGRISPYRKLSSSDLGDCLEKL